MSTSDQDRIWNRLYRSIRSLLRRHGVESATGAGEFWLVDDNYGWRRHTVNVFDLKILDPAIIAALRRLLDDLPGWEIVLAVDVPGKEVEWPLMGVTIRKHEIIDGLSRGHLPEPYRSMVIPGSRPGTGYD